MLPRAIVSLVLMGLLAACSSTSTPNHPSPKPSPAPALTQSQVTAVAKNFWDVRQQALVHNNPSLLATVYAGPALDQAQADFYITTHDIYKQHPLPKYPDIFVSASAVNLVQPPESNWFATSITYNHVDQDGVFVGQVAEGTWFFVLMTSTATVPLSPSSSPKTTPSPSPSPGVSNGTWMAYLQYRSFETLGFTQADAKLPRAKEFDYLYSASTLANDYATYLTQLETGQAPEAPYATGDLALSSRWLVKSGYFSAVGGVTFSAYPNQPLISYVNSTQDEVVFFAMQRTATYKPQAGSTCLTSDGSSPSTLLPLGGKYRSVTAIHQILIVASIPPKNRPAQGGRLLIALDGEDSDSSEQHVNC